MTVNFNPGINSALPSIEALKAARPAGKSGEVKFGKALAQSLNKVCLLYTSPSPRDRTRSRMPSSA